MINSIAYSLGAQLLGICPVHSRNLVEAEQINYRTDSCCNEQAGGSASRRRVALGGGMTRCFRHRSRLQEEQRPPAVAANSAPHSSHLNGTTSRLAIPPFICPRPTPPPSFSFASLRENRVPYVRHHRVITVLESVSVTLFLRHCCNLSIFGRAGHRYLAV